MTSSSNISCCTGRFRSRLESYPVSNYSSSIIFHRCNLSNEVNAVLVDLGIGTIVKADGLQERYGSPEYMAPEVILGNYGTKADVWSSGVVLYAMLSGYLPYQAETSSQVLDHVIHSPVPMPDEIWGEISPAAVDLLTRLLQKDPTERISAAEALQHEWLAGSASHKVGEVKDVSFVERMMTNLEVTRPTSLSPSLA